MANDTNGIVQDLQNVLVAKTNQILNLELTVTRLERELAEARAAAEEAAEKPTKKAK
jgi:predicted  nucleic acid-binding Zn-ribbon protein